MRRSVVGRVAFSRAPAFRFSLSRARRRYYPRPPRFGRLPPSIIKFTCRVCVCVVCVCVLRPPHVPSTTPLPRSFSSVLLSRSQNHDTVVVIVLGACPPTHTGDVRGDSRNLSRGGPLGALRALPLFFGRKPSGRFPRPARLLAGRSSGGNLILEAREQRAAFPSPLI